MYESHYGLNAKPFSIVPNPEILFLSQNHQNALTYLEYGFQEKAGFILLTGEIGSGKTTLVRYMLNRMESDMDVAVIFNTNFSSAQLLRRILSEFEITCDSVEKARHLELLYRFLIDRYGKGRHALLIIDEAQNLSDAALEDIRMLSNLQTDDQILLQIMLVGQPELKKRLNLPDLRQLAQRIAVNYHIFSLDEDQTGRYIAYRIQKAGGSPELFTTQAIHKIYKHAKGIPRTINLICDAALVYGFADGLREIDAAVIEKVIQDKVCMSGEDGAPVRKTVSRVFGGSGPGIMERIHFLEESVADLRRRHEIFVGELRNELFLKYQQLLATERKRYDRLMGKYTRLLHHRNQAGGGADQEAADESTGENGGLEGETKYSQLLKMVTKKNPGGERTG